MSNAAAQAGMFYARKNNRVNAAYLVASVLFTNPSNLDTITINGVVLTFVTGTPSGNQIKIASTVNATLLALQKFLNDLNNAATNSLFVTVVANVLTIYSVPINAPAITVTASAATVTAATTAQATTRARIPL